MKKLRLPMMIIVALTVFAGCKKDGDDLEDKERTAEMNAQKFEQMLKGVRQWKITAFKSSYDSPELIVLEPCQKNAEFTFDWPRDGDQRGAVLTIERGFVCEDESEDNLHYEGVIGKTSVSPKPEKPDEYMLVMNMYLGSVGLGITTQYFEVLDPVFTNQQESFTLLINDPQSDYRGYVIQFKRL